MPVTERPILLTGATGFVGMAVLARLLAAGHEVHCLVRAADDAEADSRLRAVLARVQAPASGRAVADRRATSPRPAWASAIATMSSPRGVGTVIHSAASVAFDLPIEEARAINVEGTQRVLDFAGAVPGLQRVTYVSTAYVAGDRRGTAYEDDRETGAFRNTYERSKHEAEALVRSSTLPWTIARPSIVVGESTTGWTASFNVLYGPLRAFDAGAYPVLPARRRSPVDVVSVDYVADAVAALAHHPEAAGRDLPPDRGSADVERGGDHRRWRRAASIAPPRAWSRRAPTGGSCIRSSCGARRPRRAGCSSAARSTSRTSRCACASTTPRSRALLEPMGIAPAPLGDYFGRIIEFARAARWGKRPLDRAAAVELAGASSDVRTPALRPSLGAAAMPA